MLAEVDREWFLRLWGDDRPSLALSKNDSAAFAELIGDDKRIAVPFEGDGRFGYCLYRNGRWQAGREDGVVGVDSLPSDMVAYLDGEA
jgi:hypothetical protein